MILAIDGYEANAQVRVGIGRYAYELIRHMAIRQQQKDAPFDAVRVYVPHKVSSHMPPVAAAWGYRTIGVKSLWTYIGLPSALFIDRPRADVVFSPTHYVPRFTRIPKVMAIMDISYLSYPHLFRPQDLHKLVHWTEYSVRRAAKIITISEFSKRAIMSAYHVADHQVVVAYPALSKAVTNVMGKKPEKSRLPKRYILTVGTLQPRKNFTRLIQAFSTLSDKDIALVIVGKKGWMYEEILEAPKTFHVEGRVHFLNFVSDDELPLLYASAECFVLPSLYEGFGLPVLEAMAHGVPVVVSRTSSLPEIAGKAGIYVDPEDVASIAAGLTQAMTENSKTRQSRISLGKKRAGEFTWEKAAEQVMNVLVNVGRKGTA